MLPGCTEPLACLAYLGQIEWRAELPKDSCLNAIEVHTTWFDPNGQAQVSCHPVAQALITGGVQCEMGAAVRVVQIPWHRNKAEPLHEEGREAAPERG